MFNCVQNICVTAEATKLMDFRLNLFMFLLKIGVCEKLKDKPTKKFRAALIFSLN
jgi:hypothetical protein